MNTVKNRVINTSWGTLDVLITVYAQLVVYHDLHASTAGRATAFTVKFLLFPPSNHFYQTPDGNSEGKGAVTFYIVQQQTEHLKT